MNAYLSPDERRRLVAKGLMKFPEPGPEATPPPGKADGVLRRTPSALGAQGQEKQSVEQVNQTLETACGPGGRRLHWRTRQRLANAGRVEVPAPALPDSAKPAAPQEPPTARLIEMFPLWYRRDVNELLDAIIARIERDCADFRDPAKANAGTESVCGGMEYAVKPIKDARP